MGNTDRRRSLVVTVATQYHLRSTQQVGFRDNGKVTITLEESLKPRSVQSKVHIFELIYLCQSDLVTPIAIKFDH